MEYDYQRGLRGGDCPVSYSDSERYRDWYDGHREFERLNEERQKIQDEKEDEIYLSHLSKEKLEAVLSERRARRKIEAEIEQQRSRERWLKDRDEAYKHANENITTGIYLSIFAAIVIIIVGFLAQWFLGLFKVHIPSFAIWFLALLMIVILMWESINHYKKDTREANHKYGKNM